jgi:type IV secretory pathway VirB2 component (pilin)
MLGSVAGTFAVVCVVYQGTEVWLSGPNSLDWMQMLQWRGASFWLALNDLMNPELRRTND